MQFFILLIGVLIFAFYQFNGAPISFNSGLVDDVRNSPFAENAQQIQQRYNNINVKKEGAAKAFALAVKSGKEDSVAYLTQQLRTLNDSSAQYREQFKEIGKKSSRRDTNDTNYVFLSFVKQHLPGGLRGLLIAIIFLASWGSIAAALNSLSASSVCDFHQRFSKNNSEEKEYKISKWYTLGWGLFCILVAEFANQLGQSLIEAVNVLGSLFYGVILGIFLLAFYIKKVKGMAAFWSAVVVEAFIVILFFNEQMPVFSFLPDVSFLWLNAIGAIGVVLTGLLLQAFMRKT
jgi:solute:Na+ symporter, SSS family